MLTAAARALFDLNAHGRTLFYCSEEKVVVNGTMLSRSSVKG
jgi:hypothetical protein